MNWLRNYFTPLTLLCSARHAGATPYCAAPSAAALHSCPPWQPLGPHPAVQRLRARRHTCNVQRLALGRCTVTYPAAGPPSPTPPTPHTPTRALPPLPLSPPLKSSPKSCKFEEFVRGFRSQTLPQGNILRSPCFDPSKVLPLLICC